MPQITIKTPFSFSDDGYTLVSHDAVGHEVEVSDECARVALAEGWADRSGAVQKAAAAAPENKDAAPKRKTKGTP